MENKIFGQFSISWESRLFLFYWKRSSHLFPIFLFCQTLWVLKYIPPRSSLHTIRQAPLPPRNMIFPQRKLSRWKHKRKGYKKCPVGRTVFWALWLWCESCCAPRSYEINENNCPRYSFSSYLESAHSSHSSHHQAKDMLLSLSLASSPKDAGVHACVSVHACVWVCILSPSLPSSQFWQEACALMVLVSMFISPHDGYSVFLASCFLPTWIFPTLTFPSAQEIFSSFLWLLLYLSYVSPIKAASVFAVKPHASFHPKVTAHSLPSPLPLSWDWSISKFLWSL